MAPRHAGMASLRVACSGPRAQNRCQRRNMSSLLYCTGCTGKMEYCASRIWVSKSLSLNTSGACQCVEEKWPIAATAAMTATAGPRNANIKSSWHWDQVMWRGLGMSSAGFFGEANHAAAGWTGWKHAIMATRINPNLSKPRWYLCSTVKVVCSPSRHEVMGCQILIRKTETAVAGMSRFQRVANTVKIAEALGYAASFSGSAHATKSTLRKRVWWNTGSWVTVHFCGSVARVVRGCIWTCLRRLGRCGPALSLRMFRGSWGHGWTWLSQSPAGCSAGGPRFPRPRLEAGWLSQCTAARRVPSGKLSP